MYSVGNPRPSGRGGSQQFLQRVGSPKAAHFYEVIHDMNLASLEAQFNRLGIPVKDLPCYKAWAAQKKRGVPALK